MRTYSGPLRFNATRSLYVTVRVVAVRLVGRPRHEPVRMIDRLRNKVTQFSSLSSVWDFVAPVSTRIKLHLHCI